MLQMYVYLMYVTNVRVFDVYKCTRILCTLQMFVYLIYVTNVRVFDVRYKCTRILCTLESK